MNSRKSLQRSQVRSSAPRTPEQDRFEYLLAQIRKVRGEETAFDTLTQRFRQDCTVKLAPLQAALAAATRDTVFALDRLLDHRGWSRLERTELQQLLRGAAELLLESRSDPEIKNLFDKHGKVSFDDLQREEIERLKEEAEAHTGIELGDVEVSSEEDLVQRLYEQMAARDEAERTRQEQRNQRRGRSASEQRIEDTAARARQSLREIYRKLASALHPDREPDPARREEKNELMQTINRAYASNDLLTLFEMQLQVEQIDAAHIATLSAKRLQQYNKLLSEQLARHKRELDERRRSFASDFNLDLRKLAAQQLALVIRGQARTLRREIDQQNRFLKMLADKASVKRWFKQQRRLMRDEDD